METKMQQSEATAAKPKARRVEFRGYGFDVPQGRWQRIGIGMLLIFGGILGFLPILGFWMLPLGVFVLSLELASVRRWRRKTVVWWQKRRQKRRGMPQ
jgi:hypothetical protein